MLRALALAAACFIMAGSAFGAEGRIMPFTGRLVDDLGHPITGQVDLNVLFFRTEAALEPITNTPLKFSQIPLTDGVFHITLNFTEADIQALFPMSASVAFLQIQDLTHTRTYRKHPITQTDLLAIAAPPPPPAPVEGPRVNLPATAGGATAPMAGVGPLLPPPSITPPGLPGTAMPPQGTPVPASPPVIPPTSAGAALANATAAACLAATNVGAKFSVKNLDKAANCAATCAIAKVGSQCLRGWTLFPSDQVFEFGNECGTVQIMPNLPSLGRLCCCLAQSTPMPSYIDLSQTAQP